MYFALINWPTYASLTYLMTILYQLSPSASWLPLSAPSSSFVSFEFLEPVVKYIYKQYLLHFTCTVASLLTTYHGSQSTRIHVCTCIDMRGSRGGVGGGFGPPLEFAKLNIADITGNEKISYALPQLYVKVGPPLEKISGSAPDWYSNPCMKKRENFAALLEG